MVSAHYLGCSGGVGCSTPPTCLVPLSQCGVSDYARGFDPRHTEMQTLGVGIGKTISLKQLHYGQFICLSGEFITVWQVLTSTRVVDMPPFPRMRACSPSATFGVGLINMSCLQVHIKVDLATRQSRTISSYPYNTCTVGVQCCRAVLTGSYGCGTL